MKQRDRPRYGDVAAAAGLVALSGGGSLEDRWVRVGHADAGVARQAFDLLRLAGSNYEWEVKR